MPTTLDQARKQFAVPPAESDAKPGPRLGTSPGYILEENRGSFSEKRPYDPHDSHVIECPSGLVVRVKPMTVRDEAHLTKEVRGSDDTAHQAATIAFWLKQRTEVIDYGPYDPYTDWVDMMVADMNMILAATKEA